MVSSVVAMSSILSSRRKTSWGIKAPYNLQDVWFGKLYGTFQDTCCTADLRALIYTVKNWAQEFIRYHRLPQQASLILNC